MYLVLGGVLSPRDVLSPREVSLIPGGVLSPRGCLLQGGCTWSQGVSAPGGCTWSWGGVCSREGVPGPGGCTWSQGGGTWSGTTSPLWTEFLTHASENITLPQTSFAGVKNVFNRGSLSEVSTGLYV